jgi:hypothetical protein
MTDTIKARDCSAVEWPPKDDEELQAIAKEYERDYELRDLYRQLGLETPETGRELMVAAAAVLRSRGIALADATQAELAAALERVSP